MTTELKPQYKFGKIFVTELGELVGKMKIVAEKMGISHEETMDVFLTTFRLLYEKKGISSGTVNRILGKQKATIPPETIAQ